MWLFWSNKRIEECQIHNTPRCEFASSLQASHISIIPPELYGSNPLMTNSISFMSNLSYAPCACSHSSSPSPLQNSPLLFPSSRSLRSELLFSSTTPYCSFPPRCRGKDVVIQQLFTGRKQNFICVCVHGMGQTVCTLQPRTNNIFQRRWFCFPFCGPSRLCWAKQNRRVCIVATGCAVHPCSQNDDWDWERRGEKVGSWGRMGKMSQGWRKLVSLDSPKQIIRLRSKK